MYSIWHQQISPDFAMSLFQCSFRRSRDAMQQTISGVPEPSYAKLHPSVTAPGALQSITEHLPAVGTPKTDYCMDVVAAYCRCSRWKTTSSMSFGQQFIKSFSSPAIFTLDWSAKIKDDQRSWKFQKRGSLLFSREVDQLKSVLCETKTRNGCWQVEKLHFEPNCPGRMRVCKSRSICASPSRQVELTSWKRRQLRTYISSMHFLTGAFWQTTSIQWVFPV